ncbi:MAG: response regulator transcription factor [Longimicrobiales bacterium]|nr:response regulator transcription factor [Longimicrobiales bacterium]
MSDRDLVEDPPDDVITVVLIEDNRLIREGITSVLNRFEDIEVVASGPTDHEAMQGVARPDVVLLDLGLEGGNSLAVARRVIEEFPEAGIIVMDLLPAAADLVDFITLGVSGFILKDAPLDEVARTIRSVAVGNDVLPEAMTATLFSEIAREAISAGKTEHLDSVRLTPREEEVIELIATGKSNKAIARELHISIHTAKSHLRNIMEKLNLHSRLQLARYVDDTEDEAPEAEAEIEAE